MGSQELQKKVHTKDMCGMKVDIHLLQKRVNENKSESMRCSIVNGQ